MPDYMSPKAQDIHCINIACRVDGPWKMGDESLFKKYRTKNKLSTVLLTLSHSADEVLQSHNGIREREIRDKLAYDIDGITEIHSVIYPLLWPSFLREGTHLVLPDDSVSVLQKEGFSHFRIGEC